MNIEQFLQTYTAYRDQDIIEIQCEHELHIDNRMRALKKQAAKRNIKKNDKFICKDCFLKYNNPMNQPIGKNRQTDETIVVICPHPNHKGIKERLIKKSGYFGKMQLPYEQICGSCSQAGKEIPEEQKERIRLSLTGIKRSDEFKNKLSHYMKNNPEGKQRAIKNIIENRGSGFLGKTHSEETKEQISQIMSGRKYTEEHCKNISEGRKKMLAETGGFTKEHREKLSQATLKQYANGFDPKLHHRSGWHISPKSGNVFYRSSYEKKAYLLLDNDETVRNYKAEQINIPYVNPITKNNSQYLIDILVDLCDGTQKWIEIKPSVWLEDPIVIAKLKAALMQSNKDNIKFEVWTEVKLFGAVYNEKNIKAFINSIEPEYIEKSKQRANEKSKTYYNKQIATDKIEIYCEYCNEMHNPLRLTYDKNIERNGRYICEKEGGFIAGSKPKKKKENPYTAEGKKQCNECEEIKPFEEFGLDKAKADGYATRCKKCRSNKAKANYNDSRT